MLGLSYTATRDGNTGYYTATADLRNATGFKSNSICNLYYGAFQTGYGAGNLVTVDTSVGQPAGYTAPNNVLFRVCASLQKVTLYFLQIYT